MRRSGEGMWTRRSSSMARCARRAPRSAAMAQDGLDDLVADGEARIERGHRLLEDHRQPVAAQVAQGLVGHLEQIEAVEPDRAGDLGRVFRQQPHDGERRHALAAAGFADQAERRAVGDAEVDAIDRVGGAAVVAVKDDPQALDFDQRRRRLIRLRSRSPASMPASMVARSVIPAGFLRRRQELPEMHPALAADLLRAAPARRADRRGRRRAGRDRTIPPRHGSAAPPIACRACRRRRLRPRASPRSGVARTAGFALAT